jgi:hypothetical protein
MSHINELIGQIETGAALTSGRLTMSPLFAAHAASTSYLTLDEALASGAAEVGEVSEQGQVPELLFRNRGAKPVLLLDGEELIGAKQNRVLNLSILAPADAEIRIPVSCVEARRWGYRSRGFRSSDRAHHARGRAAKLRQVSETMSSSGGRSSDQHAVWDELARTSEGFGIRSETAAMSDIFEQRRASIDDHVARLTPQARQVGAIFAVDGKIVGMDLFADPAICAKLMPKLVRSYALGAIGENRSTDHSKPFFKDVPELLNSLGLQEPQRFPAVGLGEDWRIQGDHIQAAAIVLDGRAVHLCAFAA